jgi:hypothetical protein
MVLKDICMVADCSTRMRLRVLTALVCGCLTATALAVSTSGCGGSTSATIEPVAQAADITSKVGGVHMALTAQLSGSLLPGKVTIGGQGFFNYKSREGRFSIDMSGLPASSGARPSGGLQMDEIFKSSTLYLGSSLLAGKLPGGAHWMKVDLSHVGGGLGLSLQQFAGGQSNPAQMLDYLKGHSSMAVVGHDVVRGVSTTHYHGTIDLSHVADSLPAGERAKLRSTLSKVIAQTGDGRLPVDVWIDAHRLVRRLMIVFSIAAGPQKVQMSFTIDLFGFGPTPAVTTPPAAETYEVTGKALSAIGASGG